MYHVTYHIHAPLKKVWQALVDPKVITDWGGGPVQMSDKTGEKFSLWGGEIHGTNSEVIPEQKLVQERYSTDDPEHATICTFLLSEKDEHTTVELIHEHVSEKHHKDIDEGWKDYYLGPMKDYLENN